MKLKALSNENRELDVNWDTVNLYVKKWKPFTPFEIEIVRRVPKNPDPLRKYYYGVVLPLFLEAYGYDPDESESVHDRLKIVFFDIKPDKHGIYRAKDIPSLFANDSDKDNKIKLKFIDWMKRRSAEEGVYIPDPNE